MNDLVFKKKKKLIEGSLVSTDASQDCVLVWNPGPGSSLCGLLCVLFLHISLSSDRLQVRWIGSSELSARTNVNVFPCLTLDWHSLQFSQHMTPSSRSRWMKALVVLFPLYACACQLCVPLSIWVFFVWDKWQLYHLLQYLPIESH